MDSPYDHIPLWHETIREWGPQGKHGYEPPNNLFDFLREMRKVISETPLEYRSTLSISHLVAYDGDSHCPRVTVSYTRPMTDDEYNAYLEAEKQRWADTMMNSLAHVVQCNERIKELESKKK